MYSNIGTSLTTKTNDKCGNGERRKRQKDLKGKKRHTNSNHGMVYTGKLPAARPLDPMEDKYYVV